jgi:hypothetical protein
MKALRILTVLALGVVLACGKGKGDDTMEEPSHAVDLNNTSFDELVVNPNSR